MNFEQMSSGYLVPKIFFLLMQLLPIKTWLSTFALYNSQQFPFGPHWARIGLLGCPVWARIILSLCDGLAPIGLTVWAGIGYWLGPNWAIMYFLKIDWPQLGSTLAVLGLVSGPDRANCLGWKGIGYWLGRNWATQFFLNFIGLNRGPILVALGL